MRILGFDITRSKAVSAAQAALPVPFGSTGLWEPIRDSMGQWFQRDLVPDSRESVLAFSAVYACVTLIADDISKLAPRLMRESDSGVWQPVRSASPFLTVLRKPNRHQTSQQFLSQWILFKLIHGNVFVLKERDQRGMVISLHLLDPRSVNVLVAPDTSVYYRVGEDNLTGINPEGIVVPASEIIHDRASCFFHPLVGVGPLYAAGKSATQGSRIQNNSAKFFENMSRPSGMLTAPDVISDETARRLKDHFEANYSGDNIGRLLVMGDGLKYEAMTIPAQQAQLIEQLRWTGEDVARCFHVPAYKLGLGASPTFNNIASLNQDYFSQTLHVLIEAIEGLLDEGLSLPSGYRVELDVSAFLRLDPSSRAEAAQRGVQAGYLAPNEARAKEDLEPVAGGDTPYLQQQNWSLESLAQRSPPVDPEGQAKLGVALERATLALTQRAARNLQTKGARA